ncbi:hypothetical protein [Bacteroides fragilis]|uniref:hypothetical protein n=1 Tax=Bacteroides fragilis TaxID=817 RepID=UPI00101B6157|nr:hypothetical protein [Bacteroides fragilis]
MKTSVQLSDNELNILNLIISPFSKAEVVNGFLTILFYSVSDRMKSNPLFAYQLLPQKNTGYEGTEVAAILEDLTQVVYVLYDVCSNEPETEIRERIFRIVSGAAESTATRLIPGGSYQIVTDQIYTVDESDWFG